MTTPATTPADGELLYRKKPVVIEAVEYEGSGNFANPLLPSWLWEALENGVVSNRKGDLIIKTLEGEHLASPGDWIIRGVKGELYPCKPDIFAATYEPATVPEQESEPLEWRVEVAGPAGYVRFEAFKGETLEDALRSVSQQGFCPAHDEDGFVTMKVNV